MLRVTVFHFLWLDENIFSGEQNWIKLIDYFKVK